MNIANDDNTIQKNEALKNRQKNEGFLNVFLKK